MKVHQHQRNTGGWDSYCFIIQEDRATYRNPRTTRIMFTSLNEWDKLIGDF